MADKSFKVLYDYTDVPTLKRFALCNQRVRMAMGPFGCVAEDTLIVTEKGLLPIACIKSPMRVLSWNEKKNLFELSLSGGAFPKGTDYLYRVSTPQGVFVAAGHHRVLCGDGKYRQVENLQRCQTLLSYSGDPTKILSGKFPLSSHGGGRYSLKTISDWMGHYAESARQYGQRLLQEANIYPAYVPLRDGAPALSSFLYSDAYERKDGLEEQLQAHIRPNQFYDQTQTCDSSGRIEHHDGDAQDYAFSLLFSHISESVRQFLKSQRKKVFRHIKKLFPWCFRSYSSSLSEWAIMDISREKVKRSFWDLQVLDNNNYVTEDGTIHHNSGKSSACVMEIIRRAHEQKPSPDGIRRSKWAVVRNCYSDDTEILTEMRGWQLFKDLIPEDKVATLRENKLVYKYPERVVKYPFKGKLFGYEGEGVNFLVTPEHKMWVSERHTRKKIWGKYEVKTAEEIYGKQTIRVRRDAEWNGTTQPYSLDFFEFLGFWFAEGSCGKYTYKNKLVLRLSLTQKKNKLYVENLLSRNGIHFNKKEKGNDCFVYSLEKDPFLMSIFNVFLQAGKSGTRKIPLWIKWADAKQIRAFIYGFTMGDGSVGKSIRLCTSSKQMADDLHEMCLKAGYVGNISCDVSSIGRKIEINGRKGTTNFPQYRITLLCEKKYNPVLNVNKKTTNKLKGWYKQDYNGFVYCVQMEEVPVYVRRKGKGFWCIRSYGQLKDTTIKTFHDWFPPKLFGEYRVTDHMYIITKMPGVHLEVLFRALDRPDQVSNLLSLELTGAWFNEAREIPRTIIEAMDGRIGRYPSDRDGGASWYGIIMDTNPPDEDSYLYKMFERVRPDNWEIFKQPSGLSVHAENTKHLPKNYYQNLVKGKDEMYKRIYVDGQYGFLVTGKPVFASFVDNIHVSRKVLEPERGLDVIVGFDFGLQPACLVSQITPLGQLRILDELVSDGMGLRQFCENQLLPLLRRKYFGLNVMGFGDPSGTSRSPTDESTCFEILQGAEVGLRNIVPAPTNAIIARISAVESFLNKMYAGEPGFVLSPNCHYLRKAFNGGYHYEKDPKSLGEEFKPMPAKNFSSHISDALQYLCMYISEKESNDKRWKEFSSKLKQRVYRPAISTAGY